MSTASDVLELLEKLVLGTEDEQREAQRYLSDICLDHGKENLRRRLCGYYREVLYKNDDDTVISYGIYATEEEALKKADEVAKDWIENMEIIFGPNVEKSMNGKPPGWLMTYFNEEYGSNGYESIDIEPVDLIRIPVRDGNEYYNG